MKKIILNLVVIMLVAIQWQCTESSGGDSQKVTESTEEEYIQTFSTIQVELGTIRSQVSLTGRVVPLQKIDVIARVQGIAKSTNKPFEEGITFRQGEVLITLEDDEFRSNLAAQKSQFLASLVRIMSDIKLDYPANFEAWNQYLKNLDIERPLAKLPEVNNDQLRYFLSANNISNLYHTIKGQEETLAKYTIRAPFTGAVTQAMVDPGALVSPGIKLGEFIRTDQYEVQAAVSVEDLELVEVGQTIPLTSRNIRGEWEGRVSRIGQRIDPATQSVSVYLLVSGERLKEGLYLIGNVSSRTYERAVEVPKTALTRQNQVYVIEDSTVRLKDVTPLDYRETTVVVQGLAQNDQVITDPVTSPIQGITAVSK
ncbi:MAG: efflux RND transporter periplasmic adaptor subunit [Bacteroidota bacterium]